MVYDYIDKSFTIYWLAAGTKWHRGVGSFCVLRCFYIFLQLIQEIFLNLFWYPFQK